MARPSPLWSAKTEDLSAGRGGRVAPGGPQISSGYLNDHALTSPFRPTQPDRASGSRIGDPRAVMPTNDHTERAHDRQVKIRPAGSPSM
jgi:hypothetical protein